MNKKIIMALLCLALAMAFCSKDKPGAAEKAGGQAGEPAAPPPAAQEAAEEAPPRITSATLLPEAPTALNDLTVAPVLSDPEAKDVAFEYEWYVNGQLRPEIGEEKLARENYKKGAWIYCRVRAVTGEGESEWFRTEVVRVLNSLPVLELAPVGHFVVPGDFQYQVTASDPDGDSLTYEVLEPQEQGIVIDPRTGALSWKLEEETVQRLGDKVAIKVAVGDGEGEKVTGTITLQFTSTKKRTEPF